MHIIYTHKHIMELSFGPVRQLAMSGIKATYQREIQEIIDNFLLEHMMYGEIVDCIGVTDGWW